MSKKSKEEFTGISQHYSAVEKRITKALNRAGIKSDYDLGEKSEDDLLGIFGITKEEAENITNSYGLSPKTNGSFSWGLTTKDYTVLESIYGITNSTAFMFWKLEGKGTKTRIKDLKATTYDATEIERLKDIQKRYAKKCGYESAEDYRENIKIDQIPIHSIFVGKIADILESNEIRTIGDLVALKSNELKNFEGVDDSTIKKIKNELKKIDSRLGSKSKPKSKSKSKSKSKTPRSPKKQDDEMSLLEGTEDVTRQAIQGAGIGCDKDICMLTRQQLLGIFGVSKAAVDTIEKNGNKNGEGLRKMDYNDVLPFQWGERLSDDDYILLSSAGIKNEDSFMQANNSGFDGYEFGEEEKERFRQVAGDRQKYTRNAKSVIEIAIDILEKARKNNSTAIAELEKSISQREEALGMHFNDGEWEKL